MEAAILLQRLCDGGFRTRLDAGGRLLVGPPDRLTPELRAALAESRVELAALLGDGPLPAFQTRREWAGAVWGLFRAHVATLEAQGLLAPEEATRGAWAWLEAKLERSPAPPATGQREAKATGR